MLYVQRITQIQFLKKKKKFLYPVLSFSFKKGHAMSMVLLSFTFIKKIGFSICRGNSCSRSVKKKVPVTMCMAVLGFVIEQRRSQYYMVRYHCKCLANKRFHGQKVWWNIDGIEVMLMCLLFIIFIWNCILGIKSRKLRIDLMCKAVYVVCSNMTAPKRQCHSFEGLNQNQRHFWGDADA